MSASKNIFLFSAVFFFFFLTFISILNYLPAQLVSSVVDLYIVQALQYFAIASTLIIANRVFPGIKKTSTFFASFATLSVEGILLVISSSVIIRLAIFFAMIGTFSIVLLSLFNWFWSMTEPEERGRIIGFVGLVSLPLYFLTSEVLVANLDFAQTGLSGVLLTLGVLIFLLVAPRKFLSKQKSEVATNEKRTVILYAIPWLLFSLVNATFALYISRSVAEQVSPSFYLSLLGIQVAGVSIGALVGGVIADLFGRKPSLMLSLTLYGISSALLGLTPNGIVFLFSYAANGISWGVLFVLYVFVVWGDLATEKTAGRMFSIGLAIYYSALGVGRLIPSLDRIPLVAAALASCLLIFPLNLPILFAPELLPSYFRERIRLKLHMNAVRKVNAKSKSQG